LGIVVRINELQLHVSRLVGINVSDTAKRHRCGK
jgi:hypothetical protein